jgi:pyruvate dehydrogenase E1 component
MAAAYPQVLPYDPAFPFEMAAITRAGIRSFYGQNPKDGIIYMTVYNENYKMPGQPSGVTDEMILSGLYLFRPSDIPQNEKPRPQILGSGVILFQALKAQEI